MPVLGPAWELGIKEVLCVYYVTQYCHSFYVQLNQNTKRE